MKVLVMAPQRNHHLDEEELESYALGTIPEDSASQLEEHLLICEACRRQLSETDTYLLSMRHAGARLQAKQRPERRLWMLPRFAPILAAALAVLVIGLGILTMRSSDAPPVAVTLITTRSNSAPAQAPAARPLRLQPDLEGLPAHASYRLEMVDRAGRRVWQGVLASGAGRPSATAPAAAAGLYFVRVYAPSGDLLREYALQLGE